jgi:hypothetical protein
LQRDESSTCELRHFEGMCAGLQRKGERKSWGVPDVLSLGYFSLHEQREVARSLDASGNMQDAIEKSEDAGFRIAPAVRAFPE